MLHDEEQLYSYKAFLAALDRRTCPLILSNYLAKLAATEALGTKLQLYIS